MSGSMVVWVSPYLDDWQVEQEGSVSLDVFSERDAAVAWACGIAERTPPALVRVVNDKGAVKEQLAFAVTA